MDGNAGTKAATGPDYDWIIAPDTLAYIRKVKELTATGPGPVTAEIRRAAYNAGCAHFHAGRPPGVTTEDFSIDGPRGPIPVRRYLPATDAGPDRGKALIVYYHGGGFVVGGLDSHDDVCAEFCAGTGYELVSVDYRMAPEFQHPAFFDDAYAAWKWAAEGEAKGAGRPIIVSGDSAGGTLAAAVTQATRGQAGAPAGQVLIYPGLGGDPTRGSFALNADAPMLSKADRTFYHSQRDFSLVPDDDFRAYPLRDTDFSGIPMTVCINAQCDPLADDGKNYRDAILAAGGRAISIEEPALVHGFLRARNHSAGSKAAFGRIVESLRALGAGERPSL